MERQEAKNVMVSVSITALTLGTMGVFMQRDNPFQAAALVVVALIFMAFYAMKYMRVRRQTNENSRTTKRK